MELNFKTLFRHIKNARSKKALELASSIADKACSFGSVSDEQLDKLVEMAEIRLHSLKRKIH